MILSNLDLHGFHIPRTFRVNPSDHVGLSVDLNLGHQEDTQITGHFCIVFEEQSIFIRNRRISLELHAILHYVEIYADLLYWGLLCLKIDVSLVCSVAWVLMDIDIDCFLLIYINIVHLVLNILIIEVLTPVLPISGLLTARFVSHSLEGSFDQLFGDF